MYSTSLAHGIQFNMQGCQQTLKSCRQLLQLQSPVCFELQVMACQSPNCWSTICNSLPISSSKIQAEEILVWRCKDLIWPTDLIYDPAPGFTFLGMRYPPTTQAWSRSNGSKVTCSLGLNCSFWSFFTSWANTASAGTVESMQLACHK